jgi:predicted permease
MFFTYAEGTSTFARLGLWRASSMTVTGLAEPEDVPAVSVAQGTLEALGVQPVLGRWFSARDHAPGAAETAMLGYGYWQRRFGGDEAVIGRRVVVQSTPREIVGVMPRDFRIVTAHADVIVPFRFDRRQLFLFPFNFETVGRLRPGVGLADATTDLARLVPTWLRSWPVPPGFGVSANDFEGWRITPVVRPLKDEVTGSVGRVLWVVTGTVGLVLFIACVNVANLLLIRMDGRRRELALRAALGAGAWRIIRQVLVESGLLAVAGGALGLALAYGALALLLALGPADLPRRHEIAIDGRALAFAVVVSILSSLIFGLIPAVKSAWAAIAPALGSGGRTHSGSRGSRRTRHALVIVQVALALVLLVASGLMIRTFARLHAVDPGFAGAHELQLARITIPPGTIAEPERVARAQRDIADALAAVPGVSAVAFSSAMPMDDLTPNVSPLLAEPLADGSTPPPGGRMFKFVSPGFFRAAGTRIVAGREFTWADFDDRRPVAVVSEDLAREFWGTPEAALGKRIRSVPSRPWREVVGVVADVREAGIHEPPPAIAYWPTFMDNLYGEGLRVERGVTFVARTSRAGSETLLGEIRQAVWSVNANLPVASLRTMQEVAGASMARTSFTLVMLTMAGGMALVLGVLGLYGTIAYAASERRREIGIRLALGARPGDVRRAFLRQGLVLAGLGIVVGLGAALGVAHVMTALLFEVSALDPPTYTAVALLLTAAAALASYVPARRASRQSLVEVLTAE